MRNWKELGEVPDSEDESTIDSQEFAEAARQATSIQTADGQSPSRGRDIWEVPSSPNDTGLLGSDALSTLPATSPLFHGKPSSSLGIRSPESSPLSSPPESDEQDIEGLGGPSNTASDKDEPGSRQRALAPQTHIFIPVDAVSSASVPNPGSPQDKPNGAPPLAEGPTGSVPKTVTHQPVFYERSLRPRKPIQEHPYLIENAKYTATLRSHGLKPIRIVTHDPCPPRRGSPEEDSQDADFEEDTQETAGGVDESEESQPVVALPPTADDASDPSFSPPRPRTPVRRQVLLSDDSDDSGTEVLSLDKLLKRAGPPLADGPPKKRHASSPVSTNKRRAPAAPQRTSVRKSAPTPGTTYAHDFSMLQSPAPRLPSVQNEVFRLSSSPPAHYPERTARASRTHNGMSGGSAIVDLTLTDDDEGNSSSASDSESEVVRRVAKRMRGVLPASWLRLDQVKSRNRVQKRVREESPGRSPGKAARKGVAQRRRATAAHSSDPLMFIDSESEDEEARQSRAELRDITSEALNNPFRLADDDADSVIEDNRVDWMAAGVKRKRVSSRPTARRQGAHQQKIVDHFSRSSKLDKTSSGSHGRSHEGTRRRKHVKKAATPPRLSILDVMEPKAPNFIRIAARSARQRSEFGRASPSCKSIALGTRQDTLDALSVLRDWKAGKIRQKPLVRRQPSVAKTSTRPAARRPTSTAPQTFDRQERIVDAFNPLPSGTAPLMQSETVTPRVERAAHHQMRPISGASPEIVVRPAQLEMLETEQSFTMRKKALDRLFRKGDRRLQGAENFRLERFLAEEAEPDSRPDTPFSTQDLQATESRDETRQPPGLLRRKSRFRKRAAPRCIDTSAACYVHANDPLPSSPPAASPPDVQERTEHRPENKLLGLGPFGTHYTQHFEVFPLDGGVFFHQSTLIGSGRLKNAISSVYSDEGLDSRTTSVFSLGERQLQWGVWNENTSSEMGIVVDAMMDYLQTSDTVDKAASAADFILSYLEKSVRFLDTNDELAFVVRLCEVLDGFAKRQQLPSWRTISNLHRVLDTLAKLQVVVLRTRSICLRSEISRSKVFDLDETLKSLCTLSIRVLLEGGTSSIEALYENLQHGSTRRRGIRSSDAEACAWVVLMHVLEEAKIPRGSFCDVLYSVLIDRSISSELDAARFERSFRTLFILLPLSEFDASGILVPNRRREVPLDGWALPIQVLRRVFQLYKANPRQSPSFNEYCRALVSRCHYLVEQWGWRKCAGIIGVIFDFFGSQDLAHLRNEEVYKSPHFLDDLAGSPSLCVEPDDRCFHIFLKLIALVIRQLKRLDLKNEIRNLVARTLPNHNRQHLKEQDVRHQELAALRNHHDLLCTLFWAAPEPLRPGLHLIEKLVIPGSSHKEACLLNLRAWKQLARFVAASDEGSVSYKPFITWQNNVFGQILEQYLSAESDLQQQFLALTRSAVQGISPELMRGMLSMNRAAAMDVLYFSMKSSLDVLKLARSVRSMTYLINTGQLEQVFTRFDFSARDFDWGILAVSLDILDVYLRRVQDLVGGGPGAALEDGSVEDAEDAILYFDRQLSAAFFRMASSVLSMNVAAEPVGNTSTQASCIEKTTVISGGLAALFVRTGIARLSQFFSRGKYGVFDGLSGKLPVPQRRVFPLFLAEICAKGITNLDDLNLTPLSAILREITKPVDLQSYEFYLAHMLQRRNEPCLAGIDITPGARPTYTESLNLFRSILLASRKIISSAPKSEKKGLAKLVDEALMAVSQQIKSDLGSSDPGTPAHTDFVRFVRAIIGLIKSYGPETRIDPFFLEVSPVYSPSPEDPRLQIAGITRYTLRIAEKDATATRQLLYFLVNNFKVAIANGRLEEECRLLEAAMKEQSTLTFMLETMVPTLLVMSVEEPSGWPMLQTYCQALRNFLDSSPRLLRFTDADYPSILNIVNMVGVYLSRILSHAYDNISSMMHCATHMLALVDSLLPYLDVAATKVADPATAHRIGSQRDHFIYSVQDAGIRMEETGMIGLAEPLPVPLSSIDAILDPMIPLGNATTVRELAMTLAKELHGRLLQCNGHIHLLNAHPCAPTISRQATDCPEGPRVDLCESGEFGDGRALEQVLRVIRSKWGPGEYRSARQVDMPVRGLNWCNRMQRAPWRKQWQRWGVGIKAEQYSLGVTLF